MPTYEWECKKCGVISIFMPMGGEIKKCPHCGKPVRRLLSACGFILKGSGFYQNDYKNKGKNGH